MAREVKGTLFCHSCRRMECRRDYPEGIPGYCLASRFGDVLEETRTRYVSPGAIDIYLAAGKVVTQGYRRWPRIQEAIEFAKELGVRKVGLASCVALLHECRDIAELFKGAGFTVISAACQIGRVKPRMRGVPEEYCDLMALTCNPIAQAEILNEEGTELNFIVGLCLGHDILFNKTSRAPVSTLIVKDRVLGNNPAAALSSSFHRRSLWKEYCGKDIY